MNVSQSDLAIPVRQKLCYLFTRSQNQKISVAAMRVSNRNHALANPLRRSQTQSAMQSDTRSFEAGPNVSQRAYVEDIRSYNHSAKSRKPNVIIARMITVMT